MSLKISLDLQKEPSVINAVRMFDAPRDLVFAAWTDPRHIVQWWGPQGFTTTTRSADFRPGGVWRFVMHGPDGTDYENRITFEEIVKPERIVYRHGGGEDVEPVQFKVTVLFADLGSKTRLTMRMEFASQEARDHVIDKYGADKGLVQTLARLEGHLRAQQGSAARAAANGENAMQVQPYLFLDGRAEEAIEFYKSALGAKVDRLLRMKDSPEPQQPGSLPKGSEDKVMHASIRIGETTIMLSDGRCTGKPDFKGFSLSIDVPTAAEADRLFAKLGEGGQVQMPLAKTFFSPRFGMVADRFGIGWMIIAQP